MEILLFIIIALQICFMAYSDHQNRKERELLQLKLMSKNLDDYKSATEKMPEDSPKDEEDPYISAEEASAEQIIAAKEAR